MFSFSIKRFFITLGLSVAVWVISLFIQGITLYKVDFNLFSGSTCEITGFPVVVCIYSGTEATIIQLVNIIIWFWVLHFTWKWFDKRRSQ